MLSPKLNFSAHVLRILNKEIKYLSGMYPHDLEKFLDKKLLHSHCIQSFLNPDCIIPGDLRNKLLNLMSGIELLQTGLNIHNFNISDFMHVIDDKNPETEFTHKNYTVGLLFGDVFYSRSVKYILAYNDYEVFGKILGSIKTVHSSKLILNHKLGEIIRKNKNKIISDFKRGNINPDEYKKKIKNLIEENKELLVGINSLFKNSFFIGLSLLCEKIRKKCCLNGAINKITENLVIIKTINDLKDFLNELGDDFYFLKDDGLIKNKIKPIKSETERLIEDIQLPWLRENLKTTAAKLF